PSRFDIRSKGDKSTIHLLSSGESPPLPTDNVQGWAGLVFSPLQCMLPTVQTAEATRKQSFLLPLRLNVSLPLLRYVSQSRIRVRNQWNLPCDHSFRPALSLNTVPHQHRNVALTGFPPEINRDIRKIPYHE